MMWKLKRISLCVYLFVLIFCSISSLSILLTLNLRDSVFPRNLLIYESPDYIGPVQRFFFFHVNKKTV